MKKRTLAVWVLMALFSSSLWAADAGSTSAAADQTQTEKPAGTHRHHHKKKKKKEEGKTPGVQAKKRKSWKSRTVETQSNTDEKEKTT